MTLIDLLPLAPLVLVGALALVDLWPRRRRR